VVTYNTIIIFDNPDGKLLPGETAYATIPTGDVSDTIKIPNAALRFTPTFSNAVLRQLYEQNQIPAAATTSHVGGGAWHGNRKRAEKSAPWRSAPALRITRSHS